jgi:hypothetical protein
MRPGGLTTVSADAERVGGDVHTSCRWLRIINSVRVPDGEVDAAGAERAGDAVNLSRCWRTIAAAAAS